MASTHDAAKLPMGGAPCLVRAFRCDAPLASPARIYLPNGETVIERGALSTSPTIRVPDHGMSTLHAKLIRHGSRVTVEDTGSNNGTYVNGQPCTQPITLADGDVIETGHTFFVFRASTPADLPAEPQTVAAEGRGLLATFHPTLARQFDMLARVARSAMPVNILGEPGTGKEVVARALHRLSGRKGDFVVVDCGALPGTLIESELFGAADAGTIFLDELGELPAQAQTALLRVLQEGEVTPVTDARVVTATHRELESMVDTAAFRSDLYTRLSGLTVRLLALRARREDLGLIIAAILRRITPTADTLRFSRLAARALMLHPFARNIRELEEALRLAVAIAPPGAELARIHG